MARPQGRPRTAKSRFAELRLALALRFAYTDLAQLRKSEVKKLKQDLQSFL